MSNESGFRVQARLRAAVLLAALLSLPAASAGAAPEAVLNTAHVGMISGPRARPAPALQARDRVSLHMVFTRAVSPRAVSPRAVSPRAVSPRTTAARPLPASLAWRWPLAGIPRVVHDFDPPNKPWLAGHRGVDLLAVQGAEVLAPTAGVVTFSGVVVDRAVLTITTADGLRLSFEPVAAPLRAGDAVARGQPVGTLSGKTHCDAGPPGEDSCLHWGVRRGETYLNPLAFILDLRPSVLLPMP